MANTLRDSEKMIIFAILTVFFRIPRCSTKQIIRFMNNKSCY